MNVQQNTPVAEPTPVNPTVYVDTDGYAINPAAYAGVVQSDDYLEGVAFDDTVVWDDVDPAAEAPAEEATKH